MTSFSNLPLDARIQKEAASLLAAGHEIVLIGFAKNISRKKISEQHNFRQICYPFIQMASNSAWQRLRRVSSALHVGIQIYWTTLTTSADVYHSHEAYPLPACFLAARLRGKKVVYDAHELYPGDGWTATLERFFIRKVDAVINVNEARANVLRQRYGIAEQTIVMNCPSKMIPPRSGRLRQMFNIPAEDYVVIYHGGFYPKERALDELIRAVSRLPENVHLVVLGFDSKGTKKVLQQLVTNLLLSDRVHIMDPIPPGELVEFSTGADIGVIPQILASDNQRFANPNKLFDYMASQLAVVATDAPTITPIVRGFNIGEIFRNPRADEIADAIMKLLGDPAYLQTCKQSARKAAEQTFFWEKEEEKLVSLYLRLQSPAQAWLSGASTYSNDVPKISK